MKSNNLPEWITEPSTVQVKRLPKTGQPVMSRRQIMSRKQFNRFMAGVPLEVAINKPTGAW